MTTLPAFTQTALYAPEDETNVRDIRGETDVIVLRSGTVPTVIESVEFTRYAVRRHTVYNNVTASSRNRLCNLVYGCSNGFKHLSDELTARGQYADFFGWS
jgi:hypothetical protein